MRSWCALALSVILLLPGCSKPVKHLTAEDIYQQESLGVIRLKIGFDVTTDTGEVKHAAGTCSGSIVDSRGYILTAGHCIIQDNADFEVNFQNDPLTDYKADLISVDHKHDLALIKLEHPPKDLVVLSVAGGDANVGENVFVIGMPLGNSWYLTHGIVSDYDYIDFEKQERGGDVEVMQIDANINRGNSGGPVMNDRGEIVGVVSYTQFDVIMGFFPFASGINSAISNKMIRAFLAQAEDHIPPSPTAIACSPN
jgi:S1-C subfamily serine protease